MRSSGPALVVRGAAILLTFLLGTVACTGSPGVPTTTAGGGPGAAPREAIPATLLWVLDGDTFLVEVDGVEEEVRLLGINTPEREECYADRAREAAIELTGAGLLEIDVAGDRDRYGRLLAYVYSGGSSVNLGLLECGAALALSIEHPNLSTFLDTEERSFSSGAGRWAVDACGDATEAPVAVSRVEYDPPGADDDHLEDEYVELVNDGGSGVDLTGWTLRDESSTHRYSFPDGSTLGAGDRVRVRTGCGADDADDRYWCQRDPVWSNGGDTALLLDPSGNVVDRYRYFG